MKKIAVVVFNLGGPDNLGAVKPFLFNLFSDAAIIDLPQPFRRALATVISTFRAFKARAIYRAIGGKSPILELTQEQAEALEKQLKSKNKADYKSFVCMRYWHPMSDVVVRKVKSYAPDQIILLPLYPQYSTTTTGSSFADWDKACEEAGLDVPTKRICCYPGSRGFIAAHVRTLKDIYWKAAENGKPRILFSAHGLPEKIIAQGDPYQWQMTKTVASIVQVLAIDDLDYSLCYQSRVGPMAWIGPSTTEEIVEAGRDNVPLVVVPISFVSEHSETLYELDGLYRKLAEKHGVPGYWRVPALGVEPIFIEALADLCLNADSGEDVQSFNTIRNCPWELVQCPCEAEAEMEKADAA